MSLLKLISAYDAEREFRSKFMIDAICAGAHDKVVKDPEP